MLLAKRITFRNKTIIKLSLTRQERLGNMLHSNRHGVERVGKSEAGNSWLRALNPQGSLTPAFMNSIHLWRSLNKRILALAGSCIVLALLFFFSPAQAQARTVTSGPSFQVKAGFETRYRDGNWVPVQVSIRNDSPDFNGTLSLETPTPQFLSQGNQGSPSNYQVPITLANGAQKQVTMYVPLYYDVQSVTVKLLDSNGRMVGSQAATLNPLMPGDVLVGILSDQSSGFAPLSAAPLPYQGSSVITEFLNASNLPSLSAVLKNFNVVVLDNFTTSNLSAAQLTALQTWVVKGGALITVGGPEWHRTIGPLPGRLVPVVVNGTMTIAAGTSLLPLGRLSTGNPGQDNTSDTVRSRVTISAATPLTQGDAGKSEVVLASSAAPLIVQARLGQGTTIYLAYDPTLEPILAWQGASSLWNSLLIRSLGDQLLSHTGGSLGAGSYNGEEQPLLAYRMSSLLQSLLPGTIPSPWSTLAILFAGYILVLGPVRFLLVRRLKRRDWSWRIVLSSLVLFSLLSYGIAFKEKGTSILSNSITIAQLGQNGSPASITTYLGVFVPNQGDFKVHIPGNGLVQPSPDNLPFSQGGPVGPTQKTPTTIAPAQGGTDVNLQDVNIWTLHSILSQQDRQIHKGLASQLTLQNGSLVGTVTNTLGYRLSDTFLLMSNQVFGLGNLAAGETKKVEFKLSSTPLDPNETLADQIGMSTTGSPGPYEFIPSSQSRSERQRHLQILFALDGEGFYVYSPSCVGQCSPSVPILPFPLGINSQTISSSSAYSNANVVTTPSWPYTSTRDTDPLLVPGSPATFIGWAENPLDSTDNVTVNDINPAGLHETLIQAPLNLNLAGSLDLPPNYIAGQLVDVEGTSSQIQFPGVYTISTGSMTFEFTVPDIDNLQVSGLTLTEPPNYNLFAQVGTILNPGSLPFRLYNWHSHSWDAISLNQNSFTTTNVSAYISPDGRILLQLANTNRSLGTFAFGKPSLNLQGFVLGNLPGSR